MTPSAKLGTRIAVGATIASALVLATAGAATRASGAAKTTTVAGNVATGEAGGGGPASAATLASPHGVAADAAGNIAIADTGNCRVRFVAYADGTRFGMPMQRGRIYTIAGSTCGSASAADDGPAARAHLSFPADVAFAPGGDVYVADTGNNMVRVVSAHTGLITTRAGTGHAGFSTGPALGFPVDPASTVDLDGPEGIGVDVRGDLFIADTNNCRVLEVPSRAGLSGRGPIPGDIYTLAGDGTCGPAHDDVNAIRAALRTPADVTVDGAGDVFVADTGNRVVREIPAVPGTEYGVAMDAFGIYTVAGSGTYNVYFGDGLPAASDASSIGFPNSVALDGAGNLFIADTYARAVREVPAAAGTSFGTAVQPAAVFTIAGAGPTGSSTAGGTAHDAIVYPSGITVDGSGSVLVADAGNNSVI